MHLYQLTKPDLTHKLAALDNFDRQSRPAIADSQHHLLFHILVYAHQFVPYYRELFNQIGFDPRDFLADPTCFSQLPLLTKPLIREHKARLVTTEPTRVKTIGWVKTGGTTGEPLWFAQDADYRAWNTAHDYHVMSWSGWKLGDPQFWLWGHVPDTKPSRLQANIGQLKSRLINRYDSNAFLMSDESLSELAQKIIKHPNGILWSYVSTAYRFAQFVRDKGYEFKLRAVYTAAEPLFPPQRALIEQALGCPVFNCYSSIDVGDIACECDRHDGLHITARNCYVEVVRDGQPMPAGEAGEFIHTNLTNFSMPMIRYKIEDWGRKSTRQCDCGRNLPLLEVVEGRAIDLFKTRDGRTVYGAFAKDLVPTLGDVRQFQVIQKTLDLVIFKIVSHGPLRQDKLTYLEQTTKDALGQQVEVRFEFVDSLPSSPTGKHRYLVSEVSSA